MHKALLVQTYCELHFSYMSKMLSSYCYHLMMDVHTVLLYFQNGGSFSSENKTRLSV